MNLLLLVSLALPFDSVIPLVEVKSNLQMSISHDSYAQKSKIFQIDQHGNFVITQELKDRPVSELVSGNGGWYFLGVNQTLYRVGTNGKVISSTRLMAGLSNWVSPVITADGSVWIGSKDSSSIYIERYDPSLKNRTLLLQKNAYNVFDPIGTSPQGELIVPIRNSFVSDEEWAWINPAGVVERETLLPCLAKNTVFDFARSLAFFVCDLKAKAVALDLIQGIQVSEFQTDLSSSSWTPGLLYDEISGTVTVLGRWSDGQVYSLDSQLNLKSKLKLGSAVRSIEWTARGLRWGWVYDQSSGFLVTHLMELDSSLNSVNSLDFSGGQVSNLGVGRLGEQWLLYSPGATITRLCKVLPGAQLPDCVDVSSGLSGEFSSRTELGGGRTRFTFSSGVGTPAYIYDVD